MAQTGFCIMKGAARQSSPALWSWTPPQDRYMQDTKDRGDTRGEFSWGDTREGLPVEQ